MKLVFLSLTLIALTFQASGKQTEEKIYCRYLFNNQIHCGRIVDITIHTLKDAPWNNDVETGNTVSIHDVKLLHPCEPTVILGLSKSYRDAWKDKVAPKTVRWFLKPPTSAASYNDDIVLPAALDAVKVETELVIIIGKRVKDVDEKEAKEAIFGYTVGNDIVGSVDSYHRIQGEPMDQKEKLLAPGLKIGDRFAPFGPFIYKGVDWRNRERTLQITNSQTGKDVQYRHNTSNLQYSPEKIISDLSRVLTLSPGDVIFTGTSKSFIAEPGDVVEVSVEGLGSCINTIR